MGDQGNPDHVSPDGSAVHPVISVKGDDAEYNSPILLVTVGYAALGKIVRRQFDIDPITH